jgi:hypothetical protein
MKFLLVSYEFLVGYYAGRGNVSAQKSVTDAVASVEGEVRRAIHIPPFEADVPGTSGSREARKEYQERYLQCSAAGSLSEHVHSYDGYADFVFTVVDEEGVEDVALTAVARLAFKLILAEGRR